MTHFRLTIFLKICIGIVFVGSEVSPVPCNELLTPVGFMCICNSSYCDTVPQLKPLQRSFYHVFSGRYLSGFNTNIIKSQPDRPMENGFGGSFTDSFAINVLSMSPEAQDKLLSSYFSPEGIRYSFCRVPMGSTDFSPRPYSYDDVKDDVELNNFKLQPEDYIYKIDIIKRAKQISPRDINLLTSNWSPPNWMKMTNTSDSSYLKKKYYQTYADYHVRFLEEYKKLGVEFWGLTTVNEPMTGAALHFPLNNLVMFPDQQRHWIVKNLGPALEKSDFGGLKLIVLDDQRKYINWWMDELMQDEKAAKYISGVGLHWYVDGTVSPFMMDVYHEKYPDKLIAYTESSINKAFGKDLFKDLGVWMRGALYAQNIMEGLNHWNNAWIDWNMALNTEGGPNYLGIFCDSAIIVNGKSNEFYKQPMFYALGHFSAFSQPGSVVVSILDERDEFLKRDKRETPSFPYLDDPVPNTVQKDIYLTATSNPDGSNSIFILNGYLSRKNISLQIELLPENPPLTLNLTLESESLNTLVFWE